MCENLYFQTNATEVFHFIPQQSYAKPQALANVLAGHIGIEGHIQALILRFSLIFQCQDVGKGLWLNLQIHFIVFLMRAGQIRVSSDRKSCLITTFFNLHLRSRASGHMTVMRLQNGG